MDFFVVKASTLNKYNYPAPNSLFDYEIDEPPCKDAKEVNYKILFSEEEPKKRYTISIEGESFVTLYKSMYKFKHDIAISSLSDPGFPMNLTLVILDEPLNTQAKEDVNP